MLIDEPAAVIDQSLSLSLTSGPLAPFRKELSQFCARRSIACPNTLLKFLFVVAPAIASLETAGHQELHANSNDPARTSVRAFDSSDIHRRTV